LARYVFLSCFTVTLTDAPNQGSNPANPTGSALLTIYSSDDNTLQHVINVHKLTSTDVRPTDKSLFGRTDVLAIWGHPYVLSLSFDSQYLSSYRYCRAAMSLTTHPTLDPIYLSFSSPDAHNTWLVLLRSYTSPEIYGRMVSTEKSTGGLYRMWRQIEMVVVQSRFNSPLLSSSNPLSTSTSTGNMKEKKSGGLFSKDKDKEKDSTLLDTGNTSRPGTATNAGGTNKTTAGLTADLIPLGLTNSHTPSVVTTASFTSASTTATSTGSTGSGGETPMPIVGVDGSGAPMAATMSIKSYSTSSSSLPTSDGEPSSQASHNNATTSRDAKAQAKEKEKERERRDREKEKERREKEKEKKEKEKEKAKKKKMPLLPALFAEVVLDGEVCGRTTVKRASPFSFSSSAPSSSSSPSARPSTAPSSTGMGIGSSSGTTTNAMANAGPEWFENFLFGDLPSFGNMFVSIWRAPEKTKGEEKDKRPSSSSGNNAGLTSTVGSNLNGSVVSGLTHSITTTTTMTGSTTSGKSGKGATTTTAGGGRGVGLVGGAKGTQFLGCVEISIPNFRRGEWVEGWWPVYAHANAGAGSGNKDGGCESLCRGGFKWMRY
jgi:hypothetical protein